MPPADPRVPVKQFGTGVEIELMGASMTNSGRVRVRTSDDAEPEIYVPGSKIGEGSFGQVKLLGKHMVAKMYKAKPKSPGFYPYPDDDAIAIWGRIKVTPELNALFVSSCVALGGFQPVLVMERGYDISNGNPADVIDFLFRLTLAAFKAGISLVDLNSKNVLLVMDAAKHRWKPKACDADDAILLTENGEPVFECAGLGYGTYAVITAHHPHDSFAVAALNGVFALLATVSEIERDLPFDWSFSETRCHKKPEVQWAKLDDKLQLPRAVELSKAMTTEGLPMYRKLRNLSEVVRAYKDSRATASDVATVARKIAPISPANSVIEAAFTSPAASDPTLSKMDKSLLQLDSFAVEVTGPPRSGKSAALNNFRSELNRAGVRTTTKPSDLAAVLFIDNFDSLGVTKRARVLRHPRHVVATDVFVHPSSTHQFELPPPLTELGFVTAIMRDQLRGKDVGLSRLSYVENLEKYYFCRLPPADALPVSTAKEALDIIGKVVIPANISPKAKYAIMATRTDIQSIYTWQ